ncbi:MAG: L-lysine 6-transaminase [Fidelibacterota bacterium]
MISVEPRDVRKVLSSHILADGFEPVIDLEKSHGSWIVDARDGREYLDLFSMFASMPLGYNHPRIVEARERLAAAALNKPTNSDVYSTQMAEFVETFFRVAVSGRFTHAFFIEGGALAVENALKAAFDWKVKKNLRKKENGERGSKVIHFRDCFHGRSGYTLSLTNTWDRRKTAYFPKFDWPRIVNPRVTFPLTEEHRREVESVETEAENQIHRAIEQYGHDIACLIIEPIQGEGGDNHFRGKFLRRLREICDENEILLIFDEIQTGFGLTGKMWAYEHFDAVPDLLCFGKKTQVCGFVAGERIDEVENNVFRESARINSTWGGNLTDMVRATIYLEIMEEEKILDRVTVSGSYLMEKLQSIQEDYPGLVSNVRGRGLMCAFDLPDPSLRDRTKDAVLKQGAFILGSGDRSIRFRPPLNISLREIDAGTDMVRKALDSVKP